MTRREFAILSTSLIGASQAYPQVEGGESDDWPSKDVLSKLFRENSEFFRSYLGGEFKKLPLDINDVKWIGKHVKEDEVGEPYLWINPSVEEGEVYGIIQVSKSGRVLQAGAAVFRRSLQHRPVPKWKMATAIERAAEGLKRLGWEIPPDMQLAEVKYALYGVWEVTWRRMFDGVPELADQVVADSLWVLINEEGDGLRFSRYRRGPAPLEAVPKITRSEGALLAAKALPQLMDTPIYKSWMPPGLFPMELKRIELCAVAPNWMADPKRFTLDQGAPTERRLCWCATFLMFREEGKIGDKTKEGKENSDPQITVTQGLLYIHVDALTGEIVGGDMEPIFNDGISRRFGNK